MSERPRDTPPDGSAYGSLPPAQYPGRMDALETENAQLRTALDSRVIIEQAKGILAERFGLDIHGAFLLLRRASRTSRRALHDVSAAVVNSPTTPPEVVVVMDGAGRPHG